MIEYAMFVLLDCLDNKTKPQNNNPWIKERQNKTKEIKTTCMPRIMHVIKITFAI
jgi:hypothetical protein